MRAGTVEEVNRESGDWLFVDIGFSRSDATCGVAKGDEHPRVVKFHELVGVVTTECAKTGGPLNLLIEAPLSVAFTAAGNPSGRSVEFRKGAQPRYWYLGLGCGVMVATMYLLRAVVDNGLGRDVRLFEGFVSFKKKGAASSHTGDVERLRGIVWHASEHSGSILGPSALKLHEGDLLQSAFAVLGLGVGIPPVVVGEG